MAQTNELTLKCDGVVWNGEDKVSISNMGLVVNFRDKTVAGFYKMDVNISNIDTVYVSFKGRGHGATNANPITLEGTINRLPGSLHPVGTQTVNTNPHSAIWKLTCD